MSQITMENVGLWSPEYIDMTLKESDYWLDQAKKTSPDSKITSIWSEINKGLNRVFSPNDKGDDGRSFPEADVKSNKKNILPWVIGVGALTAGYLILSK